MDKKDRLTLLLKLLGSLEPTVSDGNENIMANWVNEADSRYQAWKEGEMNTFSEEEVFKRLNKKRIIMEIRFCRCLNKIDKFKNHILYRFTGKST